MKGSHEGNRIRVRFAPSPTGYLHVGGARTAIFNWLFARRAGGKFVLRIEDTDVERSSAESEASLLADLKWLGLDWDEGPDRGGSLGPYRQSERLAMYRAAAGKMVEQGLAYPCFCSEEALAGKKEAAAEAGKPSHYDGTCRRLTAAQVDDLRRRGTPEAIRFIVPRDTVVFDDLIRGRVALDTGMVGDFIILRSNGLPTYNFAAAHDDDAMEITHVLRGEEHLSNTLRQILVYRAMGARPPVFGHVPLILAEDRSKLSKRHGASSVGELRNRGYLPGAVVNYLALLGWSHPEEKEELTTRELIESFAVERINKSAAVYDPRKLGWMNGLYIRKLPLDEWVEAAGRYLPSPITKRYGGDEQREILDLLHNKVEVMEQIGGLAGVFEDEVVYDDEAREVLNGTSSAAVLEALRRVAEEAAGDWSAENVKAMLKETGKLSGVKGQDLYFPVRAAVTGVLHGPDLARIIAVKGKESLLRSIERAARKH